MENFKIFLTVKTLIFGMCAHIYVCVHMRYYDFLNGYDLQSLNPSLLPLWDYASVIEVQGRQKMVCNLW